MKLRLSVIFLLLALPFSAVAGTPFENAFEGYNDGDYDDVAPVFYSLMQTAEQGSEEWEASRYFLAQSLYKLEFYHAASEFFYDVVKTGGNSEFIIKALEAIREIIEKHSYDRGLLLEDLVSGLEFAFLPEDLQNFIHFYQGILNKEKGFQKWATQHFKKIKVGSFYYYRVRYLDAVDALRAENVDGALKILDEIIAADFQDVDLKNQARQDVARIRYEQKRYEEAWALYSEVATPIARYASAFLEKGWTAYFLKDFSQSLGSLQALQAPIYDGFFDAEKFVVRSLIYKDYCMYSAAREVLDVYTKEYGPAVTAIKERQDLSENKRLRGALFWSSTFKKRYDFLGGIDDETMQTKKREAWLESGLQEKLIVFYTLKRKEVWQRLNADMLDGLEALSEKMLEQDEQMNLVTYEIRLDELKRIKMFESVKLREKRDIPLSHGQTIYWPFDDEFWTDELKDYKVLLENQCKAVVIR